MFWAEWFTLSETCDPRTGETVLLLPFQHPRRILDVSLHWLQRWRRKPCISDAVLQLVMVVLLIITADGQGSGSEVGCVGDEFEADLCTVKGCLSCAFIIYKLYVM
jgi:hypothetical protein